MSWDVSVEWVQQGKQGSEQVGQAQGGYIDLELVNAQNNALSLEYKGVPGRRLRASEVRDGA